MELFEFILLAILAIMVVGIGMIVHHCMVTEAVEED